MNCGHYLLRFATLSLVVATIARADNPPPKVDRPRALIPTSTAFAKVIRLTDEIAKPEARAVMLSRIARAQAATGDTEGSRRTFALAIGLVDHLSLEETSYRPHILAWIGQEQLKAGDQAGAFASYRKAIALVSAAPAKDDRFELSEYLNIIGYQIKAGDPAGARDSFETARQAILKGKGPFFDNYGEFWIIGLQTLVGDFDDVFQAISANEARPNPRLPNFKRRAFDEIARSIGFVNPAGGRGVLERLRRETPTIKGIPEWDRASLNYAIADAAVRIGASDIALEIVDSVKVDPALQNAFRGSLLFNRGRLLTEIAKAQAKAGHRDQAKATLDRAVKVAKSIDDAPARNGVLSFAQEVQIEIGDMTEALRENPLSLTLADQRRRIAVIQEYDGDRDAARKTRTQLLDEAETDLRNLRAEPSIPEGQPFQPAFEKRKDEATAKVASLKAELGDTAAAFALAQTIQSESDRRSALTAIASAQGRFGELDAAAAWIRGLKNAADRSWYVDALTIGLAELRTPLGPAGKPNP